jgi:hypothetical protein
MKKEFKNYIQKKRIEKNNLREFWAFERWLKLSLPAIKGLLDCCLQQQELLSYSNIFNIKERL